MNKIDENQIISLTADIKNGNQKSFKELFFLMQPSIYYFIFRYTCNKETAEDLTQETFINFWIHRDRIDLSKSPKSYLYKIARNLALNYLEREPEQTFINQQENYLVLLSKSTEEDLNHIFLIDDYQQAISILPERCRATFILSRFEGFAYSEIAEIMDVEIQTVKNQMNKAISVLRKLLSHHIN